MLRAPTLVGPFPFPVARDSTSQNAPLNPVSAAGDAIGIAVATADVQLVEAAGAVGIAGAVAAAQLVESAGAIGIASAAATIEDDVEAGSAVGVANASATGAAVIAAAAAGGQSDASALAQLVGAAIAVGIATANATTEDDVEQGAAIGEGAGMASAVVAATGAATGIATASASPLGAFGIGEADASAGPPYLVAAGSAIGSSDATADAEGSAPITARIDYDGWETIAARKARLAPKPVVGPAPQLVLPMQGSGSAIGVAHASATGILLFPVAAMPIVDDTDELMELFLMADLVAA